ITRHLSSIDIISLSPSTKFFRSLLMHRSAAHIWRIALQSVPELPPCPNDLCEPKYATLLSTKLCSVGNMPDLMSPDACSPPNSCVAVVLRDQ
ncbi:hypothetical protein B0J17DRAFT_583177, partial [Rhizoctonia solani]